MTADPVSVRPEPIRWGWITYGLVISILIGVLGGLLGEVYGALIYDAGDNDFFQGFRTGFSIAFVSTLIEFFYIRSVRQSWIRRVAFLPGLVVRILVLTVIVRIGLVGNGLLTQYLQGDALQLDASIGQQVRDTLFSMAVVVVFVTLSQLSSIIGFKRFINLVVGRYFRPVSEDRIFLFLDLVDSSRLARRLGNVRFHQYLSEFFYQCDRAIVQTGGEIVSYVGDAVIVTWPLGPDARRNARCLTALQIIGSQMERQAARFETEYGVSPEFRAALHGGPVVVGECGDSRRQVTFLGDVVNMTGRIESVAKHRGEKFLVSRDLADRMVLPAGVTSTPFGDVSLKGADGPFSLERLEFGKPG